MREGRGKRDAGNDTPGKAYSAAAREVKESAYVRITTNGSDSTTWGRVLSAELAPAALAFVALACILAGFAHGAIGFGFPIVATPLVALVMDMKSAIGSLSRLLRDYWFMPFAIAFGAVSGAFEATANVAGPLLLIYFMLLGLEPRQIVQTLNLCFSFGKGSQVATWVGAGAMTAAAWKAIGVLAVPSVATFYAGVRVRERIDAATYRRWLRGALWVMTAMLVGQFGLSTARAEESPLHQAVEKADRQLVESLLKEGANVNARTESGETVLHYAAFPKDEWFASRLLEAGADVRAVNSAGESALFWAALEGNVAVARRLLRAGADPNLLDAKGNVALHAAAHSGNMALVRLLLARTKHPYAQNKDGWSPRDYAIAAGHRKIARLLERKKR